MRTVRGLKFGERMAAALLAGLLLGGLTQCRTIEGKGQTPLLERIFGSIRGEGGRAEGRIADRAEEERGEPVRGRESKGVPSGGEPGGTGAKGFDPWGGGSGVAQNFNEIEVYYATDRKPSGNLDPKRFYLGERHLETDAPLQFGRTQVSIPLTHRTGVVEGPRWWRMEFREDPEKHIVLQGLMPMSPESFFEGVGRTATEAAGKGGQGKQAMLFIHGYNVGFADAVRRTAQMAWDLNFPGVPLTYSWPSAGLKSGYLADEASAEWSKSHLAEVLLGLQEKTGVEKIHIIAHSMGNRVLTGALQAARAKGFQLKLNNVILAAPDIDAPTFVQDILPQILGIPERITMYANSEDRALQASQTVHGNVPRLGLSGAGLVVLAGMDTVDATEVDESMLGHAYFGEQSRMLRDLHQLLLYGKAPEARGLRRMSVGAWRF